MEGLQVRRWAYEDDQSIPGGRTHWRMIERDNGRYVLFSDAEKFHTQLQEALGKNMKLTVDIETRNQQLTEARAESRTLRNESERLLVERDKLTAERDELREAAQAVVGDSQEWECDCPVCTAIREAALKDKA